MSIALFLIPAAFGAPSLAFPQSVFPGQSISVDVTADPNMTVQVYGSEAGEGAGPCQGTDCLGVLAPVFLVGEVMTGANGTGALSVTIPGSTASGTAYLQPVQLSPVVLGTVTPIIISPQTSVLMIGDSITEGTQSAPTALPYTTVVAETLGPSYAVTQVGCGGATSADWSPLGGITLCGGQWWTPNIYTVQVTSNLPADVVTIMLGTNDAIGFFEPAPITPGDYQSHLVALVGALIADGAGTVLLMTPPPMCSTADPMRVDRLEDYRLIIEDLCAATTGVECGPDVYNLLGPSDFNGCDVHPNGQGHEVLGLAVADAIAAL